MCVYRPANDHCVHTHFHGKNQKTKKEMGIKGRKRDDMKGTKGKRNKEREAGGQNVFNSEVRVLTIRLSTFKNTLV